jgi:hypothetical protein
MPLLHPDDREESRKAWSTGLRAGQAAEFSQRIRDPQGGYRWFLSRAEPAPGKRWNATAGWPLLCSVRRGGASKGIVEAAPLIAVQNLIKAAQWGA